VYTGQARDAIGGTTAMRAECALAVDHANTAYQQSAMSTRMRLVYCDVVSYTETDNQDTDLARLRDTSDGFMDSVHTLRDSFNADIVQLVNDTGSGLGYCPGGAPGYSTAPFSTGKWTRVAATYTTAHETGHNLGGGHDVANGGACGPSYGVGHLFGPSGDGWCSVMAYPTGTHPRILHYSNPNVTFNGYATGVAIGSPGEAFNARVIIDNDNTVEGFEATRYDIYVNFAFSGFPAEIGTAAFPYNTFAEGVANIDTPNTGAGENPTMYITSGAQNYIGTVSKVMNIIPCSGPVTIGTP
jgi:peptidyl-Asp metalloendopeptidase